MKYVDKLINGAWAAGAPSSEAVAGGLARGARPLGSKAQANKRGAGTWDEAVLPFRATLAAEGN